MNREEAYKEIAKIAAEHALIHQAYGGVIVVVHPDTQRQEGIEAHCLYVAGQGEHPAAIEQRQEMAEQVEAGRVTAQLDIFETEP